MKHYGDITKLNGYELPVVDVITGGSPCQDLSIAGKRAGLAGERSGLFMEQVRIVKEMREHDRSTGRTDELIRPRYMVWENVPGAFSSNKGEDFRAVLEEIAKVEESNAVIPEPPKGKWSHAGCIVGDGWSIAWRLHDAQFWGVPQRRKRIALVADFGGQSAPEILFERKGLSGDIETCGKEGQGTAFDSSEGVRETGFGVDVYNQSITGNVSASITAASGGTNTSGGKVLQSISFQERAGKPGGGKGILIQDERIGALSTLNNQSVCCLNDQGGSQMGVAEDVTGTLRAEEHGHQPVVFEPGAASRLGGYCWNDKAGTLRADAGDNQLAVAYRKTSHANWGAGGNNMPYVLEAIGGEVAGTLDASYYKGCGERNGKEREVIATVGALCARDHKGAGSQYVEEGKVVTTGSIVRRLTPLECERLQGFPDGWTDIGEWVDSKGKRHKDADSPRYKALGNSIALPFWFWLLRRISAQYIGPATLGSLFDGIGGFPLAWERCNGEGTAVWASEIEPFCIAVTKKHFGEE